MYGEDWDAYPDESLKEDRQEREMAERSFQPLSECDLVMKGGIASGLVYPKAVAEFARHFARIRSIGGTSAGAIAAVGAAAAEYGRRTGANPTAFEQLGQLADDFGVRQADGKTGLFNLFQPDPLFRSLYRLLAAIFLQGMKGVFCKFLAGFAPYFVFTWPVLIIAIIFGLGAALCVTDHPESCVMILVYLIVYCVILAAGAIQLIVKVLKKGRPSLGVILLLIAGSVLMLLLYVVPKVSVGIGTTLISDLVISALSIVLTAKKAISEEGFGFCSGMERGKDARYPALTTWMHVKFQTLAGRTADDDPLTFGDLWGAGGHPVPCLEKNPKLIPHGNDCAIELRTLTTCVSLGRPFAIPFSEQLFYWCEKEFTQYFPRKVIDWLKNHQPATTTIESKNRLTLPDGYYRLPHPKDMPVLLAARLSLSFPILLKAVPLYTFDFRRGREQAKLNRCWFSDGGECSNFPLHFFDSAIPSRPTFALNLCEWSEGNVALNSGNGVYLPKSNNGGTNTGVGWKDVSGSVQFLGKILNTAMDWQDNMQMGVPGFRDRIAHIGVRDDEGGLNLLMDQKIIDAMGNRGQRAAAELCRRYLSPPGPDNILCWENHLWIRFRSTMALMQDVLEVIRKRLGDFARTDNVFRRLIDDSPSYGGGRRSDFVTATEALLTAANVWQDLIPSRHDPCEPALFLTGAPRPRPISKVTARL